MHVTDSVQIQAPIEKVFEVVDNHHIEVWTKTEYDLYYPKKWDRDNPVGTTIVQGVGGVKGQAWFYTITAYDEPQSPWLAHRLQHVFGRCQLPFCRCRGFNPFGILL